MTKEINIDGSIIQLQIWDTAGSEKHNAIGKSFYRNSECCVLVCDLTDPKSFDSVESWRKEFLDHTNLKDPDNFPFVLLGNKNDIKESIKVKDEDIQRYCNSHNNMTYFSVSAKNNDMVEESFKKVADLAFKRNTDNEDIQLPEIKPLKVEKNISNQNGCKC
mgnify:CR=1 FL=1